MKKHITVLIAVLLTLVITLGCVFTVRLLRISDNYLNRLEISYRGALGELSDNLEKTSLALKKMRYSSGELLRHKGTDTVISSCSAAASGAAALPFSEENSAVIENLLSVTMDYSRFLGNKIASGDSLTEEEINNLETLSIYIDKLSVKINEMRTFLGTDLKEGTVTELISLFSSNLNLPSSEKFDDALKDFAEESESFQGLVYEGPFSSHIERREALFIKDKEVISKEEAVKIAADFLDTEKENLKCSYETEGTLAAFEITGDNMKALVTKKGGEISFAKITGDYLETKLSYEDALKEATHFLNESGFDNLKETSYVISDNTCTINFCAYENGVKLYPDLIKITLELNEGKMVEYEAEGYLMNHIERGNLTPKLSPEECSKFLKENLSVKEISLALIPGEGKEEILCYEFLCEYTEKDNSKTEILSYINAEDGNEQQLFIINRGENHLNLR